MSVKLMSYISNDKWQNIILAVKCPININSQNANHRFQQFYMADDDMTVSEETRYIIL